MATVSPPISLYASSSLANGFALLALAYNIYKDLFHNFTKILRYGDNTVFDLMVIKILRRNSKDTKIYPY